MTLFPIIFFIQCHINIQINFYLSSIVFYKNESLIILGSTKNWFLSLVNYKQKNLLKCYNFL